MKPCISWELVVVGSVVVIAFITKAILWLMGIS
jgi:hypothetical protein